MFLRVQIAFAVFGALFAITQLLIDYYECLACIKSKQTRMIKNLKIQKVSRD